MADTGEVNLNLNFKLGEQTEVFRSCSVNFKGEMLVLGGDRQRQQVGSLTWETARIYILGGEKYRIIEKGFFRWVKSRDVS